MSGYCLDTSSTFIHLPWTFPPKDIFVNNGLHNTVWASFISDLHTKFRIISRGVPCFATGSPCGRGRTTRLLCDGPLSGLWLSKLTVGMSLWNGGEDLIMFFLSISCHSVFLHYPGFVMLFFFSVYFYSEIFFYKVFCTTICHRYSLNFLLLKWLSVHVIQLLLRTNSNTLNV